MKVLLVDDCRDDLLLNTRLLHRLAHEVVCVVGAEEAVLAWQREAPDVVIADVAMPGEDGLELARRLRELAAPAWAPVILITGHADENTMVSALEMGVDTCLAKPVSPRLLAARLGVIGRLLAMQREEQKRAKELRLYYEQEQEEKRIARHLMERLVNVEKLNDPALKHWVAPADVFSGDLVAAARTPGNVLHVLLADGTGHGLAASLNVLPVTAPFYRMTERGFGIDAIAREMNAKVRELLPVERFVAATVVSVDFRSGVVAVWNGGNPPPLLAGEDGVLHTFGRHHLALGILDDEDFDPTPQILRLAGPAHLVLYSDGLLEAEDDSGRAFGLEGMRGVLADAGADPMARLVQGVQAHLRGMAARDDVSVAVIDCSIDTPEQAPAAAPAGGGVAQARALGSWRVALHLGVEELQRLDPVPLISNLLAQFESTQLRRSALFLVLSEVINQALDLGVLGLPPALKDDPSCFDMYLQERAQRLGELRDGFIELDVEQQVDPDGPVLHITCRHSGRSGDAAAGVRWTAPAGVEVNRGAHLLCRLAKRVEYRSGGTEVFVCFALTGPL